MSIPMNIVRARLREELLDTDSRNPWLNVIQYDQLIAEQFLTIRSLIGSPQLYSANAFTIGAGADTFELPTSREYAGLVRLQKVSDGLYLIPVHMDQMDLMRQGVPAVPGVPTHFALWEQADVKVEGRCWPPARVAEVINGFWSLAPHDLRSADMETVSVDLSEEGTRALVIKCAMAVVLKTADQKLAERGFSTNVVQDWQQDYKAVLYKEEVRRHNIGAIGAIMRNVS